MLLQLEQRGPEWFTARTGKITASLAAACLGKDPKHGPLSAYNQITGKTVRAVNPAMQYGIDNEGKGRASYEIATGNLVMETGLWVHDDEPWLAASPDGLVGDSGLVEIKCPATVPEAVSETHEIQMRIQMACCNRWWCDYYAWTEEAKLCERIARDLDKERDLILRLHAWYKQYILTKTPPPRRRTAS